MKTLTEWLILIIIAQIQQVYIFCQMARSYDLTDEKQSKQYLRDVEIEYQFQCYDQKEADGCHRLAEFRTSVLNNPSAGATIFKENCNNNKYPRSCYKYAQCLQTGKGAPENKPDLEGASTYYEKSCDIGHTSGCYVAGLLQLKSKEPDDKTIPKALSLFQKACDMKDGEGCFRLSTMYLTGRKVNKDLKKAFEYAVKGCNFEHVYSCNNLSLMFRHGNGVEKNLKMADEVKRRATILFDKQTNIPPPVKVND